MTNKAQFAAGCFWGVQYYFDQIPGVTKTTVGYTQGSIKDPTYDDVCTHTTGHAETLELEFDDKIINYETLVMQFFRMHDPTQLNRQGPDVGNSYRSGIYYFDDDQKAVAEKYKNAAAKDFKQPIATEIKPVEPFYKAEDYHQKFAERTGRGMCHIPYQPI